MSKAKRNALVLLAAAGMLVLLLAMSLPTLDLAPGTAFSLGKTELAAPGGSGSLGGGEVTAWFFQGALTVAFLLFPLYILFSMFSAKGRRRLVANLVFMLFLLLVVGYLDKYSTSDATDQAGGLEQPANTLEDIPEPPVAVFEEDVPAWVVTGVILIASAISIGLLAAGLLFYRQRRNRPDAVLSPLAEAAQNTLETLRAGGDFGTAIIRCYHDMNRVVKEQRGIARETAMTPREFESHLIRRGLPQHAVETLTRLFEQVRYGSVTPGTGDEAAAVACLTEIAAACATNRGGYAY